MLHRSFVRVILMLLMLGAFVVPTTVRSAGAGTNGGQALANSVCPEPVATQANTKPTNKSIQFLDGDGACIFGVPIEKIDLAEVYDENWVLRYSLGNESVVFDDFFPKIVKNIEYGRVVLKPTMKLSVTLATGARFFQTWTDDYMSTAGIDQVCNQGIPCSPDFMPGGTYFDNLYKKLTSPFAPSNGFKLLTGADSPLAKNARSVIIHKQRPYLHDAIIAIPAFDFKQCTSCKNISNSGTGKGIGGEGCDNVAQCDNTPGSANFECQAAYQKPCEEAVKTNYDACKTAMDNGTCKLNGYLLKEYELTELGQRDIYVDFDGGNLTAEYTELCTQDDSIDGNPASRCITRTPAFQALYDACKPCGEVARLEHPDVKWNKLTSGLLADDQGVKDFRALVDGRQAAWNNRDAWMQKYNTGTLDPAKDCFDDKGLPIVVTPENLDAQCKPPLAQGCWWKEKYNQTSQTKQWRDDAKVVKYYRRGCRQDAGCLKYRAADTGGGGGKCMVGGTEFTTIIPHLHELSKCMEEGGFSINKEIRRWADLYHGGESINGDGTYSDRERAIQATLASCGWSKADATTIQDTINAKPLDQKNKLNKVNPPNFSATSPDVVCPYPYNADPSSSERMKCVNYYFQRFLCQDEPFRKDMLLELDGIEKNGSRDNYCNDNKCWYDYTLLQEMKKDITICTTKSYYNRSIACSTTSQMGKTTTVLSNNPQIDAFMKSVIDKSDTGLACGKEFFRWSRLNASGGTDLLHNIEEQFFVPNYFGGAAIPLRDATDFYGVGGPTDPVPQNILADCRLLGAGFRGDGYGTDVDASGTADVVSSGSGLGVFPEYLSARDRDQDTIRKGEASSGMSITTVYADDLDFFGKCRFYLSLDDDRRIAEQPGSISDLPDPSVTAGTGANCYQQFGTYDTKGAGSTWGGMKTHLDGISRNWHAIFEGAVDEYKCIMNSISKSILVPAKRTFWILVEIELAWGFILWVITGRDLQSLMGNLAQRILWIGMMLMLINGIENGLFSDPNTGYNFVKLIPESFEAVGKEVVKHGGSATSGNIIASVTVESMLYMGIVVLDYFLPFSADFIPILNIFVAQLRSFIFMPTITTVLTCAATMLSTYVVAWVELYVALGTAVFVLGFMGTRWTFSMIGQGFLGYAISSGVKILVCYVVAYVYIEVLQKLEISTLVWMIPTHLDPTTILYIIYNLYVYAVLTILSEVVRNIGRFATSMAGAVGGAMSGGEAVGMASHTFKRGAENAKTAHEEVGSEVSALASTKSAARGVSPAGHGAAGAGAAAGAQLAPPSLGDLGAGAVSASHGEGAAGSSHSNASGQGGHAAGGGQGEASGVQGAHGEGTRDNSQEHSHQVSAPVQNSRTHVQAPGSTARPETDVSENVLYNGHLGNVNSHVTARQATAQPSDVHEASFVPHDGHDSSPSSHLTGVRTPQTRRVTVPVPEVGHEEELEVVRLGHEHDSTSQGERESLSSVARPIGSSMGEESERVASLHSHETSGEEHVSEDAGGATGAGSRRDGFGGEGRDGQNRTIELVTEEMQRTEKGRKALAFTMSLDSRIKELNEEKTAVLGAGLTPTLKEAALSKIDGELHAINQAKEEVKVNTARAKEAIKEEVSGIKNHGYADRIEVRKLAKALTKIGRGAANQLAASGIHMNRDGELDAHRVSRHGNNKQEGALAQRNIAEVRRMILQEASGRQADNDRIASHLGEAARLEVEADNNRVRANAPAREALLRLAEAERALADTAMGQLLNTAAGNVRTALGAAPANGIAALQHLNASLADPVQRQKILSELKKDVLITNKMVGEKRFANAFEAGITDQADRHTTNRKLMNEVFKKQIDAEKSSAKAVHDWIENEEGGRSFFGLNNRESGQRYYGLLARDAGMLLATEVRRKAVSGAPAADILLNQKLSQLGNRSVNQHIRQREYEGTMGGYVQAQLELEDNKNKIVEEVLQDHKRRMLEAETQADRDREQAATLAKLDAQTDESGLTEYNKHLTDINARLNGRPAVPGRAAEPGLVRELAQAQGRVAAAGGDARIRAERQQEVDDLLMEQGQLVTKRNALRALVRDRSELNDEIAYAVYAVDHETRSAALPAGRAATTASKEDFKKAIEKSIAKQISDYKEDVRTIDISTHHAVAIPAAPNRVQGIANAAAKPNRGNAAALARDGAIQLKLAERAATARGATADRIKEDGLDAQFQADQRKAQHENAVIEAQERVKDANFNLTHAKQIHKALVEKFQQARSSTRQHNLFKKSVSLENMLGGTFREGALNELVRVGIRAPERERLAVNTAFEASGRRDVAARTQDIAFGETKVEQLKKEVAELNKAKALLEQRQDSGEHTDPEISRLALRGYITALGVVPTTQVAREVLGLSTNPATRRRNVNDRLEEEELKLATEQRNLEAAKKHLNALKEIRLGKPEDEGKIKDLTSSHLKKSDAIAFLPPFIGILAPVVLGHLLKKGIRHRQRMYPDNDVAPAIPTPATPFTATPRANRNFFLPRSGATKTTERSIEQARRKYEKEDLKDKNELARIRLANKLGDAKKDEMGEDRLEAFDHKVNEISSLSRPVDAFVGVAAQFQMMTSLGNSDEDSSQRIQAITQAQRDQMRDDARRLYEEIAVAENESGGINEKVKLFEGKLEEAVKAKEAAVVVAGMVGIRRHSLEDAHARATRARAEKKVEALQIELDELHSVQESYARMKRMCAELGSDNTTLGATPAERQTLREYRAQGLAIRKISEASAKGLDIRIGEIRAYKRTELERQTNMSRYITWGRKDSKSAQRYQRDMQQIEAFAATNNAALRPLLVEAKKRTQEAKHIAQRGLLDESGPNAVAAGNFQGIERAYGGAAGRPRDRFSAEDRLLEQAARSTVSTAESAHQTLLNAAYTAALPVNAAAIATHLQQLAAAYRVAPNQVDFNRYRAIAAGAVPLPAGMTLADAGRLRDAYDLRVNAQERAIRARRLEELSMAHDAGVSAADRASRAAAAAVAATENDRDRLHHTNIATIYRGALPANAANLQAYHRELSEAFHAVPSRAEVDNYQRIMAAGGRAAVVNAAGVIVVHGLTVAQATALRDAHTVNPNIDRAFEAGRHQDLSDAYNPANPAVVRTNKDTLHTNISRYYAADRNIDLANQYSLRATANSENEHDRTAARQGALAALALGAGSARVAAHHQAIRQELNNAGEEEGRAEHLQRVARANRLPTDVAVAGRYTANLANPALPGIGSPSHNRYTDLQNAYLNNNAHQDARESDARARANYQSNPRIVGEIQNRELRLAAAAAATPITNRTRWHQAAEKNLSEASILLKQIESGIHIDAVRLRSKNIGWNQRELEISSLGGRVALKDTKTAISLSQYAKKATAIAASTAVTPVATVGLAFVTGGLGVVMAPSIFRGTNRAIGGALGIRPRQHELRVPRPHDMHGDDFVVDKEYNIVELNDPNVSQRRVRHLSATQLGEDLGREMVDIAINKPIPTGKHSEIAKELIEEAKYETRADNVANIVKKIGILPYTPLQREARGAVRRLAYNAALGALERGDTPQEVVDAALRATGAMNAAGVMVVAPRLSDRQRAKLILAADGFQKTAREATGLKGNTQAAAARAAADMVTGASAVGGFMPVPARGLTRPAFDARTPLPTPSAMADAALGAAIVSATAAGRSSPRALARAAEIQATIQEADQNRGLYSAVQRNKELYNRTDQARTEHMGTHVQKEIAALEARLEGENAKALARKWSEFQANRAEMEQNLIREHKAQLSKQRSVYDEDAQRRVEDIMNRIEHEFIETLLKDYVTKEYAAMQSERGSGSHKTLSERTEATANEVFASYVHRVFLDDGLVSTGIPALPGGAGGLPRLNVDFQHELHNFMMGRDTNAAGVESGKLRGRAEALAAMINPVGGLPANVVTHATAIRDFDRELNELQKGTPARAAMSLHEALTHLQNRATPAAILGMTAIEQQNSAIATHLLSLRDPAAERQRERLAQARFNENRVNYYEEAAKSIMDSSFNGSLMTDKRYTSNSPVSNFVAASVLISTTALSIASTFIGIPVPLLLSRRWRQAIARTTIRSFSRRRFTPEEITNTIMSSAWHHAGKTTEAKAFMRDRDIVVRRVMGEQLQSHNAYLQELEQLKQADFDNEIDRIFERTLWQSQAIVGGGHGLVARAIVPAGGGAAVPNTLREDVAKELKGKTDKVAVERVLRDAIVQSRELFGIAVGDPNWEVGFARNAATGNLEPINQHIQTWVAERAKEIIRLNEDIARTRDVQIETERKTYKRIEEVAIDRGGRYVTGDRFAKLNADIHRFAGTATVPAAGAVGAPPATRAGGAIQRRLNAVGVWPNNAVALDRQKNAERDIHVIEQLNSYMATIGGATPVTHLPNNFVQSLHDVTRAGRALADVSGNTPGTPGNPAFTAWCNALFASPGALVARAAPAAPAVIPLPLAPAIAPAVIAPATLGFIPAVRSGARRELEEAKKDVEMYRDTARRFVQFDREVGVSRRLRGTRAYIEDPNNLLVMGSPLGGGAFPGATAAVGTPQRTAYEAVIDYRVDQVHRIFNALPTLEELRELRGSTYDARKAFEAKVTKYSAGLISQATAGKFISTFAKVCVNSHGGGEWRATKPENAMASMGGQCLSPYFIFPVDV